MIKLVFIDGVAIDHLIQHVKLPPTKEHQRITNLEGKFVFYLDIAYCETVFKLKFSSFNHVLGSLQYEIDLKVCAIEDDVSMLNINFFGFPHDSPLADVLIVNVKEVNLIRFLSQKPLLCVSCIVLRTFRFIANMKRIKASIQILHLITYTFKVFYHIFIVYPVIFYSEKNLLDVPIECIK